jgi:hypothetical protein
MREKLTIPANSVKTGGNFLILSNGGAIVGLAGRALSRTFEIYRMLTSEHRRSDKAPTVDRGSGSDLSRRRLGENQSKLRAWAETLEPIAYVRGRLILCN